MNLLWYNTKRNRKKEWGRIFYISVKKSWWIVVKTSVYEVNSLRVFWRNRNYIIQKYNGKFIFDLTGNQIFIPFIAENKIIILFIAKAIFNQKCNQVLKIVYIYFNEEIVMNRNRKEVHEVNSIWVFSRNRNNII